MQASKKLLLCFLFNAASLHTREEKTCMHLTTYFRKNGTISNQEFFFYTSSFNNNPQILASSIYLAFYVLKIYQPQENLTPSWSLQQNPYYNMIREILHAFSFALG